MPRSVLILALTLVGPFTSALGQTVRSPSLHLEFHRAVRAWRTGANLFEAKVRLDRVIRASPEDAQALLVRARVLLDLGRPEDALADARSVTDLEPDDGRSWLVRAEAAARTGSAGDEALDALDRAADRLTEGVDEHVRLSRVAQILGDVDRAEAFARIGLALGPDEPAAFFRLAEVFVEQGRTADAETLIARGLSEGVLSGAGITAHPLLSPFADAPAIRPLLRGLQLP